MKRTIYYMILCLLMSLGEIMAQGISGKVMDGKEQQIDGVEVILQTIESSARPVVSTYFPTHLI